MSAINTPRLNQRFVDQSGNLTQWAYAIISGLFSRAGGTTPSYENNPAAVTVTGSPFTYQNNHAYSVGVIVSGGGCGNVEVTRDGTTWLPTGHFYREHLLSPGDKLRVTYTTAPTIYAVPR